MFPQKEKLPVHSTGSMNGLFVVFCSGFVLAAQVGGVEGQHNAGRNHHNGNLLSK